MSWHEDAYDMNNHMWLAKIQIYDSAPGGDLAHNRNG
jgi:hypothetical protein